MKKDKELVVSFWILDGFVGILGLMIYNFILYLTTALGAGGILNDLQNTMGYFGLLFFIDLGFSPSEMSLGLIFIFMIAFFLGASIGNFLRKTKRHKGRIL